MILLIRLLVGFPIFFFGALLPFFGNTISYIIGCFIALIGTFLISRGFKGDAGGFGFALIGFPAFFYSMSPHAFEWFGISNCPEVFITKISLSFVSGIAAFLCFNEE
jgi:hypothetical protein